MTDTVLQLQAEVHRLTVCLWIIGGLFTTAIVATAYLLFFAKGEEE